jgi:hypothetical protein
VCELAADYVDEWFISEYRFKHARIDCACYRKVIRCLKSFYRKLRAIAIPTVFVSARFAIAELDETTLKVMHG